MLPDAVGGSLWKVLFLWGTINCKKVKVSHITKEKKYKRDTWTGAELLRVPHPAGKKRSRKTSEKLSGPTNEED